MAGKVPAWPFGSGVAGWFPTAAVQGIASSNNPDAVPGINSPLIVGGLQPNPAKVSAPGSGLNANVGPGGFKAPAIT